jgi:UDP-N-acetylenolpyruvoylglucosamine reductase
LCAKAAQFGLEGFEFLEGIPGSLGGSLRMNAGAMGFWIFDIVKTVYFLDSEGKTRVLDHKLFNVEYRKCKELVDGIALGAVLKSTGFGDPDGIRDQMTKLSFHRKSSQPKEPSAGCIFKNPPNGHAGKLIDELGLKGTSVGGAEISNTHGNFIINNGNASSEDVLKLVKKVRDHILETRGIELEPEALLIGDSWESIL